MQNWHAAAGINRKARDLITGEGVFFNDSKGLIHLGSVRIKEVRCGKKNCKKCPHKIYAYARYRDGKKVLEKYLGVAR